MSDISKQISSALEGMAPDAVRAYLADLKRDAVDRVELERVAVADRAKELMGKTQDELTEQISNFNVRTGDHKAQREAMKVLGDKQRLSHDLANLTQMSSSDYAALDAKRSALVQEAASLRGQPGTTAGGRPSAARLRGQAIAQELKSLPGNPDVVIPPPEKPADE